jgi:hypothetical protein
MTQNKSVKIPFHLDASKSKDVARVMLFASRDEGRIWTQVAEAHPAAEEFVFHAREEGTYWFDVATVDHQGKRSPKEPSGFNPALKIQFVSQK